MEDILKYPIEMFLEWKGAWAIWFTGNKIDDSYMLWGKNIIYWDRVGQIIQFIGGVVIVFEVIGPERSSSWGKTMLFSSLMGFLWIMAIADKVLNGINKVNTAKGWCFIITLSLILIVTYAYFKKPDSVSIVVFSILIAPKMIGIVILSICLVCLYCFILSMLVYPVFFLIWIIGSILRYVMSKPYATSVINVVTLISIIVGVHFTLLAS